MRIVETMWQVAMSDGHISAAKAADLMRKIVRSRFISATPTTSPPSGRGRQPGCCRRRYHAFNASDRNHRFWRSDGNETPSARSAHFFGRRVLSAGILVLRLVSTTPGHLLTVRFPIFDGKQPALDLENHR